MESSAILILDLGRVWCPFLIASAVAGVNEEQGWDGLVPDVSASRYIDSRVDMNGPQRLRLCLWLDCHWRDCTSHSTLLDMVAVSVSPLLRLQSCIMMAT